MNTLAQLKMEAAINGVRSSNVIVKLLSKKIPSPESALEVKSLLEAALTNTVNEPRRDELPRKLQIRLRSLKNRLRRPIVKRTKAQLIDENGIVGNPVDGCVALVRDYSGDYFYASVKRQKMRHMLDIINVCKLTEKDRVALNRLHVTFYAPAKQIGKRNPHIDLIYKRNY